jgi:hypothetical protein
MVSLLLASLLLILAAGPSLPDDLDLYVPGAPTVPLDIQKGQKTILEVTRKEAREINSEFRGILAFGAKRYPYDSWPGREMADCVELQTGPGSVCQMITGNATTDFYFFKTSKDSKAVLEQMDVRFPIADPMLLKALRPTCEEFFNSRPWRDYKNATAETGWSGHGWGSKWQTGEDLAYLYMDTQQSSPNGEGVARFQWRRSPLTPSK